MKDPAAANGSEFERDKSLSFYWKCLDDSWLDGLGLPPAVSAKAESTRASILTEAVVIGRAEPRCWISYSRRKEFYAGKQRYRGIDYTYSTVPPAIDQLADLGLLENDQKSPGNFGWQSRFRATKTLLERITSPLPVLHVPLELIRLKDKDGHLADYRDTAFTEAARRSLMEINEALEATRVDLEAPGIVRNGDTLHSGELTLYTAMQTLYRVFNRRKFTLGGRLYGPWWQQARKDDREHLKINGDRVAEPDYAQLHPRMLYAMAGDCLEGDAYTLDGWERSLVKKAFNILINGETYQAAVRAVMNEIRGVGAKRKAEQLIAELKRRHRPIERFFHSGEGLRLQRQDSDMAERVIKKMLAEGVVVLPIHDSFITPKRYEGRVREEMDAAFFSAFPPSLSRGYAAMVPHMAGVVGFVLPLPAQGDLFPVPVRVPGVEISSWRGGHIPPGLRAGVVHEMQRRNLRQVDLARRVGLSRPHLTNALRGRFGVGVHAAKKLKDFVLKEALTD